ncbi:Leucine Rich Repeat family protein, expressed [Heracleum sosnowskyi]|uniref:Leucine Rich Repeat family protein, expressed n=1 Tax=Heracleum sosnowskyi TaxID=360622 RepID=A0AAD8IR30_9APIA|nr:Leucine Rich Repeat family protein, expressed [Heracleum sosnowskyi]
MVVTDFFVGEIATELLKMLFTISRKAYTCKLSADNLIETMNQLQPIIQEIKYSGVELPELRQRQLDTLSQSLHDGRDLALKVLKSSRWNVYKNLQLSKKMEKVDKNISRFLKETMQAHILADVHHLRFDTTERFDRIDNSNKRLEKQLGAMKIGTGFDGGGLLEEAVKRVEEDHEMFEDSLVNMGVGFKVGKRKIKEMVLERDDYAVVGISGMGGSGKTTLAKEISRDDQIKSYYSNRILFLTVSQSPNVEVLRQKIWGKIFGDLIFRVPGCKTLVVSRFKFPPSIMNCTYELELLRQDEAISLFCFSVFHQTSVPFGTNDKLVKQVVDECKGLPLALKVIGASLREQPEMFWTSAKNRLSRGQPICESHEIQLLERMKLSIDCLSDKVRECFMDFGCFPEDKKIPLDVLINIWVELHDIDEEEAFAILVELSDKNLLNLVKDERAGDMYSSFFEISVSQHDLLRDLAIYLSNRNRINQRKRLLMPRREEGLPKDWERNMDQPFDARVVSIHTGEMTEMDWFSMEFPKAEVLIINFSSSEYALPHFIENMPKLRALVIINYSSSSAVLHNTSVFSNLGNLTSLWFEKVSVPQLPSTTTPLKKLRKISLVLCKISPSHDQSSLDMPLLFPQLEELTMDHCIDLIELHPSICHIKKLKSLSVTNCDSLTKLPTDIGSLKFLQILRISACPNLDKLPPGICELTQLKYIDISQCISLRSLPQEMGKWISLEKMDMRECPQIKVLPRSVVSLRSLLRVICDEEISKLFKGIPNLYVQVAEECFNLDWLAE